MASAYLKRVQDICETVDRFARNAPKPKSKRKPKAGKGEVKLGPDEFVTPTDDPLLEWHEMISSLAEEDLKSKRHYEDQLSLKKLKTGKAIAKLKPAEAVPLVRAMTIRTAHILWMLMPLDIYSRSPLYTVESLYRSTLSNLLRRTLPLEEDDLLALSCVSYKVFMFPYHGLTKGLENYMKDHTLSDKLRKEMIARAEELRDNHQIYVLDKPITKNAIRILELVNADDPQVTIQIQPGEAWSDVAIEQLSKMKEKAQRAWAELIQHAGKASGGKPTAKWTAEMKPLLKAVPAKEFKKHLMEWFPLVDNPRTQHIVPRWESAPDPNLVLNDDNADVLKGLVWMCAAFDDPALARTLRDLALSTYRKIPMLGPRATKVGNACVWALGEMPGLEGIAQLALVKVRVRYIPAQRGIQNAIEKTANRLDMSADDVEELTVPAYGMTDIGVHRESLGDYTAELVVGDDNKTEIRWIKPDGAPQKTLPAPVKKAFANEVKELRQAAKDIAKMLPAQRDRIDRLFLEKRDWSFEHWKDRYLTHPLLGVIVRDLIWRFRRGRKKVDALPRDGGFIDANGKPVDWIIDKDGEDVRVELWHPIDHSVKTVTAWRDRLMTLEVRQRVKQAFREVYRLTDAERQTETYSNRFAGHLIKPHQFNALCRSRGWTNELRLMVDSAAAAPMRKLPKWGLRAEFWIAGAGDNYDTDTNDSGTYLYLSTDQVRFYHIDAAENWADMLQGPYTSEAAGPGEDNVNAPVALAEIPPLVFSEMMRDVDLFIGVGSIGNDPTWEDGGTEGRYRDYWQTSGFGDLLETARTRRDVLARIVPRLKIADRCDLTDRFLVVRGDRRTYKIHIGSANILMEPNDEYLCIVQKTATVNRATGDIFLPFDGDRTLAIILSKALLLADDTKIKDKTILSQIKR